MFKARAQISLEYIIITGFILVVVIIPTFLLLFSTTNNSIYNTINIQKVEDLSLGILNDAKQMYYLGLYSNKVVDYEMPRNVDYLYILKLEKPDGSKEYYLGITITNGVDSHTFNFLSDVPLTSRESVLVEEDNSLEVLVPVCMSPGYSCEFYSFIDNSIAPGKKKFKVETLYDSDEQMVVSRIYPI
jgi:hypothetical protein